MKDPRMKDPRVKDSTDAIDKVLAGLRDSELPLGMEGRILRRLEDAASERSNAGWWTGLSFPLARHRWPAMTAVTACATLLAVLLGFAVVEHHSEPSADRAVARPPMQRLAINGEQARSKQGKAQVQAQIQDQAQARTTITVTARASYPRRTITAQRLRAVSYPAPPMPLTQQEKLLIQVVRERNMQAAMLLNQGKQEAQLARNNDDFQIFFAVPAAAINPPEKEKTADPKADLKADSKADSKPI